MLNKFLQAIHEKRYITVYFTAKDSGMTKGRKCVPFDYGVSRKYKDGVDRFHFLDLDSPDGNHNLSIKPEQIHSIMFLDEYFDPNTYVKWTPNWIVPRNWGRHS